MSPTNPAIQAALQNLKINDLAENTRIGGVFTPQGLEEADRTATANAADRLMLKAQLVRLGLGGTHMGGGMY